MQDIFSDREVTVSRESLLQIPEEAGFSITVSVLKKEQKEGNMYHAYKTCVSLFFIFFFFSLHENMFFFVNKTLSES